MEDRRGQTPHRTEAGRRAAPRRLLHRTKVAFPSADVFDTYRAGNPDAVELVEALRDALEESDGGRRPALDALAFTVNTGTPGHGGGWLVVFRVTAPYPAVVRLSRPVPAEGEAAEGGWEYQIERVSGRTRAAMRPPPEPAPPCPYPPEAPAATRFLDL